MTSDAEIEAPRIEVHRAGFGAGVYLSWEEWGKMVGYIRALEGQCGMEPVPWEGRWEGR